MAKAASAATTTTPAAPAKSAKRAASSAPGETKAPAKAKGAAAVTEGAAVAVISLKHLAAGLAESHAMPKRQVEAMLGEFVQSFTEHLAKGTKIRIPGLGIFQVRSRAARMGRNPATGEPLQIKASKKIAFRPAKELKDAV